MFTMIITFLGLLLFVGPIPLPSSLEKGDKEFAAINYSVAETYYKTVLTAPDSAETLWRLARVYICMADVAPENRKLDLYRRAEAFASRCIQADSTKSEGYTWRAAALGNIAMFEGGKTKVKLCHVIKQELEHSINLNPVDDIAYSILGSFYMALGNVSWIERQLAAILVGNLPDGGYDESENALKTAITLAPGVIRHRYELGLLYMAQDRFFEAHMEFRQVLELPVLLASDERTQLLAAALVKDIHNE